MHAIGRGSALLVSAVLALVFVVALAGPASAQSTPPGNSSVSTSSVRVDGTEPTAPAPASGSEPVVLGVGVALVTIIGVVVVARMRRREGT